MMVIKICLYFNQSLLSQNLKMKKARCSQFEIKGGIYTSKLKPLYTAFLNRIKLSGFRMRMKFYQDSLTVEQNNYKALKVYIAYDLDNWLKVSLRNFTIKKCLFGATTIAKKQ